MTDPLNPFDDEDENGNPIVARVMVPVFHQDPTWDAVQVTVLGANLIGNAGIPVEPGQTAALRYVPKWAAAGAEAVISAAMFLQPHEPLSILRKLAKDEGSLKATILAAKLAGASNIELCMMIRDDDT